MKKKIIALIAARKNSIRIHNKNMKKIGGKKLIWHSINAALKSKYISEVIVSTDCKKIKSYAESMGAKVPFLRPKYLSNSKAQMIDVVKHTYKKLSKSNDKIDHIMLLQPTSPLRDCNDIDSAIKYFFKKKADYLTSFSEAKPTSWYFQLDNKRNFNYFDVFKKNKPNKKNYLLNGAIYIYNKKLLENEKKVNLKCQAFIMSPEKSIDIDNQYEFKIADYLLKKNNFI
tara:strand:+ start:6 stop:689 length:684 start_codon:yes stop_codon:yes gene_type:complete